jgi:lysine-N-methylase
MKSKIRTLPIVEQWDCHHCTACCRETTIQLNPDDLQRLTQQQWDQHPEYCGIQIVRRSAWLGGAQVLAHKADGSCVFLTNSGRCRIHEEFGLDAKPFVCRLFPLQVLTTDREAFATVVRSCPSAAAERGRPLSQHLDFLRRLLGDDSKIVAKHDAPRIVRRARRSWDDFYLVTEALQRLLSDDRVPLVRRLVHCLRFCTLLEQCKWNRVATDSQAELIELLEQLSCSNVGELFENRQPPSKRTSRLFRRLGAHFVRCFPGGRPNRTLSDHWYTFRLSGRLARATTTTPELHPQFRSIELDQLERPLGPLTAEVLQPLSRLFEAHGVSKRYALAQPGKSLVESARRLTFAFPMALWMLRWVAADREPIAEDMVQIVVAIERGLELPALSRAIGYMAESGQLERLIAWYGR